MSTRPWLPDRVFNSIVHGLLKDMRAVGCRLSTEGTGLLVTYPGDGVYQRFSGQVHEHRQEIRIVLNTEAVMAQQRKELHDDYDTRRLDRSSRTPSAASQPSRGQVRAF